MNLDALSDDRDLAELVAQIRHQALTEAVRVTLHAQQEMAEEDITLDQVLEAAVDGQVLEWYMEHQRGACCLLYGRTNADRPLHIVCTVGLPILIIITVYEPALPRWVTPTQRRRRT